MRLFGNDVDAGEADEQIVPPTQELTLSDEQFRYMVVRRLMHIERRDRLMQRKLDTIIAILTAGKMGVTMLRWVVSLGVGIAAWWALFHPDK